MASGGPSVSTVPPTSTVIFSANRNMRFMSCSMNTIETSRGSAAITPNSCALSPEGMPAAGSSRSSTRGLDLEQALLAVGKIARLDVGVGFEVQLRQDRARFLDLLPRRGGAAPPDA